MSTLGKYRRRTGWYAEHAPFSVLPSIAHRGKHKVIGRNGVAWRVFHDKADAERTVEAWNTLAAIQVMEGK